MCGPPAVSDFIQYAFEWLCIFLSLLTNELSQAVVQNWWRKLPWGILAVKYTNITCTTNQSWFCIGLKLSTKIHKSSISAPILAAKIFLSSFYYTGSSIMELPLHIHCKDESTLFDIHDFVDNCVELLKFHENFIFNFTISYKYRDSLLFSQCCRQQVNNILLHSHNIVLAYFRYTAGILSCLHLHSISASLVTYAMARYHVLLCTLIRRQIFILSMSCL